MIEKNVKLYLGDWYHPVRIPVSQYDTMWRFVFSIVYNSQPWIIPRSGGLLDTTAILNGRKPDGNVFAFAGIINGDNTVTVDCDVQMTAVAGQTVCELSILSDGKVVGTANFVLDVEAAPKSPDDVSSETTLPAYGEILDRIVEMEGGGGGGSVTVDAELTDTSQNPVQAKAIYKAIENLHGENILYNGLPHKHNTLSASDSWGWFLSRGSSSITYYANASDGFQTVFPVGITSSAAKFQWQKHLIRNGVEGVGAELARLKSGNSVSISFELNSDVALEYVNARLTCAVYEGGTKPDSFYFIESSNVSDTDGDWVCFEGHGVIPDWWDDARHDQYTKNLVLIIEFKASDTDFDGTVAKTVRIRNIKMEFGNRCTPFSLSTLDLDDLAKMVADKANRDSVYAAYATDTASGSIASFLDGADDIPVKDLTVAIEPMQSGTGDPSPDNIRPISGWTGANIHVSPTTDAADGTTYSIAFPSEAGTVYGGTLDVTTGKLTVENALITIDNQEMNNANVDNVVRVRVAISEDSMTWSDQATLSGKLLSNMFVEGSNSMSYNGEVCFHYRSNGAHEIVFGFGNSFPGVQSYAEAVAWLKANNPTVLYWLATPVVYDLTPTEVTTLLAQNNIWADCGDSTVEYRADTALYIDKKIAAIPNASGVSF